MPESKRTPLILIGFAGVVLLIAVMGVVTFHTLSQLLSVQETQEHSLEVRRSFVRVLSLLSDAESGQRGFIITGNEAFLEPYDAAMRDLPAEMESLKNLLLLEPNGRIQFERLEELILRKLERTSNMIVARRERGYAVAEKEVASGAGKAAMDAIRREISQLDRSVSDRLIDEREASDAAGRRAQRIVLSASVLAALSAAFSLEQVRRGFKERAQAKAEIEHTNAQLERKVADRTSALLDTLQKLEAENLERRYLESQVLQISEREQRRIAEDLHDGHAQLLAGSVHLCNALVQRLAARSLPEAKEAENLKQLIREALDQTRAVARGLHPVKDNPKGLIAGLEELCSSTTRLFEVECEFKCPQTVLVDDNFTATHLYRIAQEAISNAVKHGNAKRISIHLNRTPERLVLEVRDNGCGFPAEPTKHPGIGLSIMKHRASIIQGALWVENLPAGGAMVACTVTIPPSLSQNLPA